MRLKRLVFYLLLLVVVLGVIVTGIVTALQGDEEIQQLLQNRSPIEIWQSAYTPSSERTKPAEESPLVREAKIYADLLNPPKPPKPATPVQVQVKSLPKPAPRPGRSSPKFEVYATCVYQSDPKKSTALISEPGSGFRWVSTGDKIGYFTVKEVSHKKVVCLDGDKENEVIWECRSMKPGLPGFLRPTNPNIVVNND